VLHASQRQNKYQRWQPSIAWSHPDVPAGVNRVPTGLENLPGNSQLNRIFHKQKEADRVSSLPLVSGY
jgi:hypothetical protein